MANVTGRILANIRSLSGTYPQMRIGQLLCNVTPPGKDLFYISDEELLKALEQYAHTIMPLQDRHDDCV